MWKRPQRSSSFGVSKTKAVIPTDPPDWYFTPARSPATRNVLRARADIERFRDELQAIHPAFDLAWHPLTRQFILWARNPRITFEGCAGWQLIVVGLRLDTRGLAFAASRCARHVGSGSQYIRRVMDEMQRDQAAEAREQDNQDEDWRKDRVAYWQIKNVGSGSKFEQYHSA